MYLIIDYSGICRFVFMGYQESRQENPLASFVAVILRLRRDSSYCWIHAIREIMLHNQF